MSDPNKPEGEGANEEVKPNLETKETERGGLILEEEDVVPS